MTRFSPVLLERVDAGYEWANENIPDWPEFVDVETLDISNGRTCFLGQYWNGKHNVTDEWSRIDGYNKACRAFFSDNVHRIEDLGFMDFNTFGLLDLTEAWKHKIRNPSL